MKKYIGIISIILGLLTNIALFNQNVAYLLGNLFPILLIGVIGVIAGILSLTKYKKYNNKIVSIIGLIISLIPLAYFGILFIALG